MFAVHVHSLEFDPGNLSVDTAKVFIDILSEGQSSRSQIIITRKSSDFQPLLHGILCQTDQERLWVYHTFHKFPCHFETDPRSFSVRSVMVQPLLTTSYHFLGVITLYEFLNAPTEIKKTVSTFSVLFPLIIRKSRLETVKHLPSFISSTLSLLFFKATVSR